MLLKDITEDSQAESQRINTGCLCSLGSLSHIALSIQAVLTWWKSAPRGHDFSGNGLLTGDGMQLKRLQLVSVSYLQINWN